MVMTDPARGKEVANGDELVARIDSGERSLNGGLNDPKSEEENKVCPQLPTVRSYTDP